MPTGNLSVLLKAGLSVSLAILEFGALAQARQTHLCSLILPTVKYEITAKYRHNIETFTQGLEFHKGDLYESSGLYGKSSVARLDASDYLVQEQMFRMEDIYFAEGLTWLDDVLYLLTWKSGKMFLFDHKLQLQKIFDYKGEGWGLTNDTHHLIMSNGTQYLQYLDPQQANRIKAVEITENGHPLYLINELEWVDGYIFANIWLQLRIVIIDPQKSKAVAQMNIAPLFEENRVDFRAGWPNGIAYRPSTESLLLTGKNWQWIYEVALPELADLPDCP